MGSAASTAAQLGRETGGSSVGGIAAAAKGAAAQKMRSNLGLGTAAETGRRAAWSALHGPARLSSVSGGGGGGGRGKAQYAPPRDPKFTPAPTPPPHPHPTLNPN